MRDGGAGSISWFGWLVRIYTCTYACLCLTRHPSAPVPRRAAPRRAGRASSPCTRSPRLAGTRCLSIAGGGSAGCAWTTQTRRLRPRRWARRRPSWPRWLETTRRKRPPCRASRGWTIRFVGGGVLLGLKERSLVLLLLLLLLPKTLRRLCCRPVSCFLWPSSVSGGGVGCRVTSFCPVAGSLGAFVRWGVDGGVVLLTH